MAISVSSYSSGECVRTPVGRFILFGIILIIIYDTTPTISPPTTRTDNTVTPTEIPTILPTVLPIVAPSPDHTPALPDIILASPDYLHDEIMSEKYCKLHEKYQSLHRIKSKASRILSGPNEANQADCNVKATNIILQALPLEIYALERECKLYDAFDKFEYQKGETLRDFYLRFSLLLNDMNMYNMKLEQFQDNTKFLNTLPPEWKFSLPDTGLVVPVFQKGDDPIEAINHMMSFLTSVVTS
nr:hypothetical protein [Tanacetum cinerariifolium]